MRLDQALVKRGLVSSRSRAKDAIDSGHVTVDGQPASKPGQKVGAASVLDITEAANPYVSRAGLKLAHAMSYFSPDVNGALALDVGASTGGFTQVLLENGAAKVFAVDVGHGQLHEQLREDERVVNLEGLNARELSSAHIGAAIDVIVSDVSFISLKLVLPPALALARSGAWLLALIKPQFEAGRDAIGKGGIVRDEAMRARVCSDIQDWLESEMDWRVSGLIPSPIHGSDGNVEFIVAARKP